MLILAGSKIPVVQDFMGAPSWPIRIRLQAYEVDKRQTFNWKQALVITECIRESWFTHQDFGRPNQTTYTFHMPQDRLLILSCGFKYKASLFLALPT
jgi:hypothetical protein